VRSCWTSTEDERLASIAGLEIKHPHAHCRAHVTDYLGKTLVEARAPESGVVLFIRAVPSMTKGETIANIGVPVR
jgi:hypothetical protein